MSEVIVVTGPPGAGKSVVAAELAGMLDPSALVPGDAFFRFLRSGAVPPWLEEAHRQNTAVIEAAAAASGRLAGHCAVVYDGVLGPWVLPTFLTAAGLDHLHYAVLLPGLDVCLERVRTRSGHEFRDLAAAEHMWHDFHRAELGARHVVSGHDIDPAGIARSLVERVVTGALRYP